MSVRQINMLIATICATAIAFLAAPQLRANDADSTATIDPVLLKELTEIDARLAKIEDLQAAFTQEKRVALLKKPLISKGTVLVKGQHVRWEVTDPSPSTTLTTPGEIRIHYPKQKLVEVYKVDERMAAVVASPLPRLEVLRKHFKIERAAEPKAGHDEPTKEDGKEATLLRLRLTPLKEELSKHIARVDVVIDREQAIAKRIEIVDADGDRTAITFDGLQTNKGVKDERFKLDLPAGTRVVRPLEAVE